MKTPTTSTTVTVAERQSYKVVVYTQGNRQFHFTVIADGAHEAEEAAEMSLVEGLLIEKISVTFIERVVVSI